MTPKNATLHRCFTLFVYTLQNVLMFCCKTAIPSCQKISLFNDLIVVSTIKYRLSEDKTYTSVILMFLVIAVFIEKLTRCCENLGFYLYTGKCRSLVAHVLFWVSYKPLIILFFQKRNKDQIIYLSEKV